MKGANLFFHSKIRWLMQGSAKGWSLWLEALQNPVCVIFLLLNSYGFRPTEEAFDLSGKNSHLWALGDSEPTIG